MNTLSIIIIQTSDAPSPAPLAPPRIHACYLPRTPNPSRQQRKTALQPRASFPRNHYFPISHSDQHHNNPRPFPLPHPRLPRPHPHHHLPLSNLHPPRPLRPHLPKTSRPRHRRKILAQNQRLRRLKTHGANTHPFRNRAPKTTAPTRQTLPIEK